MDSACPTRQRCFRNQKLKNHVEHFQSLIGINGLVARKNIAHALHLIQGDTATPSHSGQRFLGTQDWQSCFFRQQPV